MPFDVRLRIKGADEGSSGATVASFIEVWRLSAP